MPRLLLFSSTASLSAVALINLYQSALGFESIFGSFRSMTEILARGLGEFIVFWSFALSIGALVSFIRRKSTSRNRGVASSVFATFFGVVVALVGVHHPHHPLEHVALRGTLPGAR